MDGMLYDLAYFYHSVTLYIKNIKPVTSLNFLFILLMAKWILRYPWRRRIPRCSFHFQKFVGCIRRSPQIETAFGTGQWCKWPTNEDFKGHDPWIKTELSYLGNKRFSVSILAPFKSSVKTSLNHSASSSDVPGSLIFLLIADIDFSSDVSSSSSIRGHGVELGLARENNSLS